MEFRRETSSPFRKVVDEDLGRYAVNISCWTDVTLYPSSQCRHEFNHFRSQARFFPRNSSCISISTSVTTGGIVLSVLSFQNLPFTEGLPLNRLLPSMMILPLLFASFTHPDVYLIAVSNDIAPNTCNWEQIAKIISEQRACSDIGTLVSGLTSVITMSVGHSASIQWQSVGDAAY
jgi:hypothetical protein